MRQRLLTFGILAAALVAASPAYAQTLPQGKRPYAGLFGGSALDARNSQGLNVTGSLGGGYDDDLNRPSSIGTNALRTGSYGIAAGSVSYGLREGAISGSLSGGGRARYYPNANDPLIGTFAMGGSLSVPIGTRVTADGSAGAGVYLRGADFYGIYGDLNSGGVGGPDETLGAITNASRYTSVNTSIGFNVVATQRIGVYGRYQYYTNNLLNSTGGRYNATGLSGGVSYAMTKYLSARVGYTRTAATAGGVAGQSTYGMSSFDGGVDFNKALSLTRHGSIAFNTGLAGVADQNGTVRYVFLGSATLIYELGRSWTLNGTVGRSTNFFAAFAQPTIQDRANISVHGLLSRRLETSISAALFRSESLSPIIVPGYVAGHSGVSMKYAINRDIALTADYSYYHYEFDNNAPLPIGVFSQVNRQSVRVAIDVWAPLLTKSRRQ